ncbi:MAG: preprotein translocase subunit YajC [Pseudomonadota bacterium]
MKLFKNALTTLVIALFGTMVLPVAHAGAAGGAGGDAGLINLIFLGGFVLIFYFLLIRPQNKRRKEHQALVGGLSKGDEVVTAGGIVGQITKVEDDFVKVQVGDSVEMRIQKSAVGATLPKGTIKSLEAS